MQTTHRKSPTGQQVQARSFLSCAARCPVKVSCTFNDQHQSLLKLDVWKGRRGQSDVVTSQTCPEDLESGL